MSENEESKGIKVSDRRRFDAKGNEKGDQREVSNISQADTNRKDVDAFSMKDAPPQPEISFGSFVVSLATQVLMQLGQMSPPPGVKIEKDVEAAKQTIDILAMLKEKTKGNLDAEEANLIEEILHNLRMGFVRSAGAVK